MNLYYKAMIFMGSILISLHGLASDFHRSEIGKDKAKENPSICSILPPLADATGTDANDVVKKFTGVNLKCIPAEVLSSTQIRALYLGGNLIREFPSRLCKLPLKVLWFGEEGAGNQLTRVPKNVAQLTALTSLNLGSNKFKEFPMAITGITALTELYMDNNQLSIIPPEISRLTRLSVLKLGSDEGGNDLTFLPSEIGYLTNLTYLSFEANKLTTLPTEIGKLTKLRGLFIGDNQLTSKGVPKQLWNLKGLEVLQFGTISGGNKLNVVPSDIGKLVSLTELSLTSNALTALPTQIGRLTNMQSLHLSANRLRHLPAQIGNFPRLSLLVCGSSLGGNPLAGLPSQITNLTNLTSFALTLNQFTHIPKEIFALTSLQQLYLAYNSITHVPSEIGALSRLEVLSLCGNKGITKLPKEVFEFKFIDTLSLDSPLAEKYQPVLEALKEHRLQARSKLEVLSLGGNKEITELPKLEALKRNRLQMRRAQQNETANASLPPAPTNVNLPDPKYIASAPLMSHDNKNSWQTNHDELKEHNSELQAQHSDLQNQCSALQDEYAQEQLEQIMNGAALALGQNIVCAPVVKNLSDDTKKVTLVCLESGNDEIKEEEGETKAIVIKAQFEKNAALDNDLPGALEHATRGDAECKAGQDNVFLNADVVASEVQAESAPKDASELKEPSDDVKSKAFDALAGKSKYKISKTINSSKRPRRELHVSDKEMMSLRSEPLNLATTEDVANPEPKSEDKEDSAQPRSFLSKAKHVASGLIATNMPKKRSKSAKNGQNEPSEMSFESATQSERSRFENSKSERSYGNSMRSKRSLSRSLDESELTHSHTKGKKSKKGGYSRSQEESLEGSKHYGGKPRKRSKTKHVKAPLDLSLRSDLPTAELRISQALDAGHFRHLRRILAAKVKARSELKLTKEAIESTLTRLELMGLVAWEKRGGKLVANSLITYENSELVKTPPTFVVHLHDHDKVWYEQHSCRTAFLQFIENCGFPIIEMLMAKNNKAERNDEEADQADEGE